MKHISAISLLCALGTSTGTACVGSEYDTGSDSEPNLETQSINACPYQSIQARVQPNIQTPWTQTLSVSDSPYEWLGSTTARA